MSPQGCRRTVYLRSSALETWANIDHEIQRDMNEYYSLPTENMQRLYIVITIKITLPPFFVQDKNAFYFHRE